MLTGVMAERHAALIYDGTCAYCRRLVGLLHLFDRSHLFVILPYDGPRARNALEAQFGVERGFTMYLFTTTHVYWAQSAARQATRLLGLPAPLGWLVGRVYPALVRVVSALSWRRRAVCVPGAAACFAASDKEGSMPIALGALEQLGLHRPDARHVVD